MSLNGRVLVLSQDEEVCETICAPLRAAGIEAVPVTKAAETIKRLVETEFDLLIVDSTLRTPSAVDFLGKAREFLPSTLRALYETESLDLFDWRDVINRAEPSAVFSGSIDLDQVKDLVERRRKMMSPKSVPAAAASVPPARPATPQVLNLRPLQGPKASDVKAASLGGVTMPNRGAVDLAVMEEKAESGPLHFSEKGKGEPLVNSPVGPPQYENMKLELDLMTDDMTAEVSRVLDLMLEEPDIKLPILPQVANEVRKLVSQENVSFERLSEVVALEPTMSARILEVANSPLYAGRETTRNLQQAVSRIGLRETRNILSAISAENLFKVSDRRMALLLTKLWMHSLACAYSNEIMAKDLYIAESGDYFMLGLLHDVGKLLILQLIQQGFERKIWNKRTITDELLDEILTTRHNRLGARLIQKWGYDKVFEDVVYLHDDSYYVHEYDEAVVVTFFSNQMTRLMGFSLLPYDQQEDFLGHHEIAQALNMNPDVRQRIETALRETLRKIQDSYFRGSGAKA
jgi:HD-like signal output (HDOD) protein